MQTKFIRWFDGLIYRLFYWRWNKKLAENQELFDFFLNYMIEWKKRKEVV
jgi:hypothetical protein